MTTTKSEVLACKRTQPAQRLEEKAPTVIDRRHYRNGHLLAWVRVVYNAGGEARIGVQDHKGLGLYHLGLLWARERGYIVDHGTDEPISHTPRRFRFALTAKGRRVAQLMFGHSFRYDHFRAGMLCDRCGEFRSDFL